jgi:hypothetical protein
MGSREAGQDATRAKNQTKESLVGFCGGNKLIEDTAKVIAERLS